ncbi:DnaJ domain-containing protein [Tanacetum coccineum]
MQSTSRAEAERLLGIAEKLLQNKDLNGCRDFALLAQETEPLLDGSDQILAIVDVLIASDKKINNQIDWYAILQLDSRRNQDDVIKRQYRRLALLLHPDKNKFPFADVAFKFVADAWALLSDHTRKSVYDNQLFVYSKVDLVPNSNNTSNSNLRDKIPVRRGTGDGGVNSDKTMWTTCPYCYNLYEYPKKYRGCCLRCANCRRAFQAVEIPVTSLPPVIPGKEAYYCCWSYFPMGFAMANSDTAKTLTVPNTMPTMFPTNAKAWPAPENLPTGGSVPLADPAEAFAAPTPPPVAKPSVQKTPTATPTPPTAGGTVPRKRGRPRKNL